MNLKKCIVFSAPSGTGKSTLLHLLLKEFPQLIFSISATTRAPRGQEVHGKEYYFLTAVDFQEKIKNGELAEWEEVYAGAFYGTLKSELDRIWQAHKIVIFDLDVKGALRLKQTLKENLLAIFIAPKSLEDLEKRLTKRGTENASEIAKRMARANEEISLQYQFDAVVVNDDLITCLQELRTLIQDFLQQ